MKIAPILVIAFTIAIRTILPTFACAEEVPAEYRAAIAKGLEWLSHNQHSDGHWEANGHQQCVAMTALASMALLMEGSTIRDGKYHDNIRRAVDWLMQRSQPNGLISSLKDEAGGYMYGHGFSMLFLSSVIGEEEDVDRRRKLVDILERAASFSHHAQGGRGGWIYISAKDARALGTFGEDEGSVTITQLQGLRAARNAGIAFPTETIRDAIKYLRDSTNADGGVRYKVDAASESRPAITAAAIVCGFSTGEYESPLVKKWFKFCRVHLSDSYGNGRRAGHDEYTYYYYAQAIYMLGEDGWAKLFPDDKRIGLTWSAFRKASFGTLVKEQAADGSWSTGSWGSGEISPVYTTALHLSILQLDKAVLPIYQR